MAKFFAFLIVVALVLSVAAGAVLWYVQPERQLDLSYTKISVADKILDMVQRRSFEVNVTEADLNNLVKAALAARTELPHNLKLTGVDAKQHGDVLTVDANLLWQDRFAVGATLTYRMSYREPNLLLTRESVRVKQLTIPPGWLQFASELSIDLYDKLPKLVGIQNVAFDSSGIRIALKLR
jgi:hypothetical protein